MQDNLATKQTKEEKMVNTLSSFRFEAYLVSAQQDFVFEVLHPEGRFLKSLNRHQFICYLKKSFIVLQPFEFEVTKYTALDFLPGTEVISIKYKNNENISPFESSEPCDLMLQFTMRFRDGLIDRIYIPKHRKNVNHEEKEINYN
jgi:hypothetical protein